MAKAKSIEVPILDHLQSNLLISISRQGGLYRVETWEREANNTIKHVDSSQWDDLLMAVTKSQLIIKGSRP